MTALLAGDQAAKLFAANRLLPAHGETVAEGKRHREHHTSWETVQETLKTHQVVTLLLPSSNDRTLRVRRGATPDPEQAALYRALRVPHA